MPQEEVIYVATQANSTAHFHIPSTVYDNICYVTGVLQWYAVECGKGVEKDSWKRVGIYAAYTHFLRVSCCCAFGNVTHEVLEHCFDTVTSSLGTFFQVKGRAPAMSRTVFYQYGKMAQSTDCVNDLLLQACSTGLGASLSKVLHATHPITQNCDTLIGNSARHVMNFLNAVS
jgi:hypothetical protein